MKKIIQKIFNLLGYKVLKIDSDHVKPNNFFFPEASEFDLNLIKKVKDFTLTDYQSIFYLIQTIKHVKRKNVVGDFVECGVWRGGNLVVFSDLIDKLELNKKIYAFDTFSGMTDPESKDTDYAGKKAADHMAEQKKTPNEKNNVHCIASLYEVQQNLNNLSSNSDRKIKYIEGPVEKTLNYEKNLPEKISILRLDTDWYSSTKKELEILYPRLVKGGVLIIDDYGSWKGCKQAVDEFFENSNETFFQINKSRVIFK